MAGYYACGAFIETVISSRSSLKLGQKLGHQAKSKEDLVNTLEVTFFEAIIMNLTQNVCLHDFSVKFETGSPCVRN